MANVTSIQTLVDGPRNVVVKYEGILDTSDIAASGTIGTAGFTTTTGSPNITFTAGSLVPTVGQYLTFSDGTATFPANTYVVSITSSTAIVVSNNATATNAAAAKTITGTSGAIVVIDPAKLSQIDSATNTNASTIAIKRIYYDVEDVLAVNLFWEATSNTRIWELAGRGFIKADKFGFLVNNAGAGKTGRLVATTQGWTGTLSFSIILECVKQ
jgi:hypothetical protein